MYAIIETSGHQYKVQEGTRLKLDKRPEEPGSEIVFDKVLLVAGDATPSIGTPYVSNARVVGKLESTRRGPKIIIRKFKRRKNYRRKKGHRQTYSTVLITQVSPG